MIPTQGHSNVQPADLSDRESQILHLAALGHTDAAIATELGIRPATVNSYWVRIRAKLGSHSRGELIASVVRRQAEQERGLLTARVAELEALLSAATAGQADEPRGGSGHTSPLPMLILDARGVVHYASSKAGELFCCDPEVLHGRRSDELFEATPFSKQSSFLKELKSGESRAVLGVDPSLQMVDDNGDRSSVFLLVSASLEGKKPMTVCLLAEVDYVLHMVMGREANLLRVLEKIAEGGKSGKKPPASDGKPSGDGQTRGVAARSDGKLRKGSSARPKAR